MEASVKWLLTAVGWLVDCCLPKGIIKQYPGYAGCGSGPAPLEFNVLLHIVLHCV